MKKLLFALILFSACDNATVIPNNHSKLIITKEIDFYGIGDYYAKLITETPPILKGNSYNFMDSLKKFRVGDTITLNEIK